jgi:hypothetical protein
VRLTRSDIPTDDLEAAQTHLGQPGTVIEDEDLDAARNEVRIALECLDDADNTYEDRVSDGRVHAERSRDALESFEHRVRALHAAGALRVGNATAAAVIASCVAVHRSLEEWIEWATRELSDLD